MKITFLSILLSITSSLANASSPVPAELSRLIPVGMTSYQAQGETADGAKCQFRISNNSFGFAADILVMGEQGQLDSRRLGKFQIGLGHNLVGSIQQTANVLTATSYHVAEESYSSDTRSILTLTSKNGVIHKAKIRVESKFFFLFRTDVDETCFLNE